MSRSHRSIQAQVIILSLAFTALIALSVFLASIVSLYHSTLRATTQSAEYNLQTLANTLRQNVQEIDSLANWCTVDSTLRNFVFASLPERQLLDVYNTLLNKYSSQYTARYLSRLVVTDGAQRTMQQGTSVAQSLPLTAERLEQLPGFAGGSSEDSWTTLGTVTSLGINPYSENQEAAADFINWCVSDEGAAAIAATGTFPAVSNPDINSIIAATEGFPTDEASVEALNTTAVYLEMPLSSKASEIESVLNEEHDAIMTYAKTVDDGIASMNERVGEILSAAE